MILTEIITIELAISIAQLIKNSCGRILRIWSYLGSNSQLSFPGKKTWWKVVNAASKSMETNIISTPKKAKIERAEIKATLMPNGRQSVMIFFLFNIKRLTVRAADTIKTIRFRLNNTLQS